jgi:hypothetical protein
MQHQLSSPTWARRVSPMVVTGLLYGAILATLASGAAT